MSQILQNLPDFKNFSLIIWQILKNAAKRLFTCFYSQRSAPIQPKTSEILPKFCQNCQLPYGSRPRAARGAARPPARAAPGGPRRSTARRCTRPKLCWLMAILQFFAKFCKFLAGSFSAISKRNFARKYAFDSIFQALQDVHTFAPLQSQFF